MVRKVKFATERVRKLMLRTKRLKEGLPGAKPTESAKYLHAAFVSYAVHRKLAKDDRTPTHQAARPHNIHRGSAAARIKKKPSNLVFLGHDNFNIVLNMMLGIQRAVRSHVPVEGHDLTNKDFKNRCYFELVPK
jgi:hypothetical protein